MVGLIRGKSRFSNADRVTSKIWYIKFKTEKKINAGEGGGFKSSTRSSSIVAGHAFTPLVKVTRLSRFDNAHSMSWKCREAILTCGKQFSKLKVKLFSWSLVVKSWENQHFQQITQGIVWRNWPDVQLWNDFLQRIVFCIMTGQGGDMTRQSLRAGGVG